MPTDERTIVVGGDSASEYLWFRWTLLELGMNLLSVEFVRACTHEKKAFASSISITQCFVSVPLLADAQTPLKISRLDGRPELQWRFDELSSQCRGRWSW
jgi:hypothetical protein